ncbi:hypothetical protein F4808DRAFT_207376 [Astrocystis sublimbata]|nr:hypothetical protein F4808DRAFT_207376 [Astrocystis sublimbata]
MSFTKFTCIQCTRRLSRLALSPRPAIYLSTPHHLFSTTPRPRRKIRVAAVPTRDTFARVRFTRADVPPLEFWAAHARAPLVTDLSADDCFQTARRYASAALKNATQWREHLIDTTDSFTSPDNQRSIISAYTLHYVAAVIMLNQPGGAASHMALHILHTLAGLGYTPSILTMVRMALQRRMLHLPQFEPAVQGFERILRRIGDGPGRNGADAKSGSQVDFAADACTLRALMYAAENTRESDNNALRWFRKAYEIGGSTAPEASTQGPPSPARRPSKQQAGEADANEASGRVANGEKFSPVWQWEVSFALGIAAIRLKRGELDKAADMYTFASSELDNAMGYLGLADVLEKTGKSGTDERYVEALNKAAVSGILEAARKLANREWDGAAEGGLSTWEKRKRQVVAEEWMAIAG